MPLITDINNDVLLERTSIVIGSLSLICCIIIILNFLIHEKLRTFCFKMICMLALCQLFCSLATTMGHVKSPILCGIQATMRGFFQISLIGWTLVITFTMYITITKQRMGMERYFMHYNLGIWLVASILTILPAITQSYGRDFDNLCWITDVGTMSLIWHWAQFYCPLWISYIIIIWMYIKIEVGFKSLTIRTQVYIIKRLKKYPIVIFITYLFPSIHRILLDLRINNMALNMFHKIIIHSGGILLFIIFISSSHVRATNMFYIYWCFRKLRVIHMSPEQQKEKTLENPLSFDSDEERSRPSDTASMSETKSEIIDWSLNLNCKQSAALTTATAAYGEMSLYPDHSNNIELPKIHNKSSIISEKSTKSSQSICDDPQQTDTTQCGEYRGSDSSMTR